VVTSVGVGNEGSFGWITLKNTIMRTAGRFV